MIVMVMTLLRLPVRDVCADAVVMGNVGLPVCVAPPPPPYYYYYLSSFFSSFFLSKSFFFIKNKEMKVHK